MEGSLALADGDGFESRVTANFTDIENLSDSQYLASDASRNETAVEKGVGENAQHFSQRR
jgi:hypothetical protein